MMMIFLVRNGFNPTINSVGNIIDFKFKNNTSSDIIIIAYTEGNNLHMEIYGVPFETDEYDEIKIRTKQVSSQSIKTVYEYLDNMAVTDALRAEIERCLHGLRALAVPGMAGEGDAQLPGKFEYRREPGQGRQPLGASQIYGHHALR